MDASKKQNMSHAKLYIVNFFFKNSHWKNRQTFFSMSTNG
jgi:hypothetical protein